MSAWAVAGLPAMMIGAATAQPLSSELKRFMDDDASAYVHVRSFIFDRQNPAPPNNVARAGGGWVGLQTGWLYDIVQLGAAGYTTQPLWPPADTDGTQLLKPRQYGFFALGQAFASVRAQVFTGYRQMIDELEVNPNDDRMIPLLHCPSPMPSASSYPASSLSRAVMGGTC